MRVALVIALLLVAAPAHAWQPPSGGPSKMAKRVLDTLPEPTKVAIPKQIEDESRRGVAPVTTTAPPSQPVPSPGGCWQVQITAVSEPDRARDLAAQEASRLGVPVHVVTENGLAKVRAGEDCLSYDDATKLRDRARDSGYPGAFVIRQSGGSGS
jgi:cell division septation protein DedD